VNAVDPSGLCSEDDGWSECDWISGYNYGIDIVYDPWNSGTSYGSIYAGPNQLNPADFEPFVITNPLSFLWGSIQGLYNQGISLLAGIQRHNGDPVSQAVALQILGYRANASNQSQKIGMAIGGPLLTLAIPGAGEAELAEEAASLLPDYLYYYTDEATAALIEGSQLGKPGGIVYLTGEGGLSPLQAQLELALPQRNTATAAFRISTKGLDPANVILAAPRHR
jgi:hypothetical protein